MSPEQNYAQAVECFRKAAEQGEDAKANLKRLGEL
jgi:TPR repeat protein